MLDGRVVFMMLCIFSNLSMRHMIEVSHKLNGPDRIIQGISIQELLIGDASYTHTPQMLIPFSRSQLPTKSESNCHECSNISIGCLSTKFNFYCSILTAYCKADFSIVSLCSLCSNSMSILWKT